MAAPPLLPVFRSTLQGELLALVLPNPDRSWTARELSERLGAAYQTTVNELRRLERAGVFRAEHRGRTKLITPNRSNPYFEPLERLATMSFGPPFVITEELAQVAGIEDAFVFGSWAARYEGQEGPPPRDVDVLVIGRPDRDLLFDAAERARKRLGQEVNVIVRPHEAWSNATDGFTEAVRQGPLVALRGPWTKEV